MAGTDGGELESIYTSNYEYASIYVCTTSVVDTPSHLVPPPFNASRRHPIECHPQHSPALAVEGRAWLAFSSCFSATVFIGEPRQMASQAAEQCRTSAAYIAGDYCLLLHVAAAAGRLVLILNIYLYDRQLSSPIHWFANCKLVDYFVLSIIYRFTTHRLRCANDRGCCVGFRKIVSPNDKYSHLQFKRNNSDAAQFNWNKIWREDILFILLCKLYTNTYKKSYKSINHLIQLTRLSLHIGIAIEQLITFLYNKE